MKKIVLASFLAFSSSVAFAQNDAVNKMLADETCKTLEKAKADADKASADPKKSIKASTWLKRAQAYEEVALNCSKLDSNAAVVAYESYKKGLEVEADGGKSGKDLKAGLAGQKMYASLMQQGANYYNGKNVCKAVKAFTLASDVNPKDTTAMLYAGVSAQQCQDSETAKIYFNKFVEAGGKDAAVFYSLSNIYRQAKDDAKALATLKKGLAVNPTNKDLQGEIVNFNISSGNKDQAIAELKTLIASEGEKNAQNMLNLGILLDSEESLVWYNKVLAIEPNNYDCNFNMGVYYFNAAVKMKGEVDKMDMKTYQKEGKVIEDKVCAKFSESKPFFEKAKSAKAEQEVVDSLTNLTTVLDQCSKRK